LNVLVAMDDGMGNGLMTTPMIQIVHANGHTVDVVCSYVRCQEIAFKHWDCVKNVFDVNQMRSKMVYDAALWSWNLKNLRSVVKAKLHYMFSVPGKDSDDWIKRFKKHEVLYNVDQALKIGCKFDEVPKLRVYSNPVEVNLKKVAIGIGYLKSKPHWKVKWIAKHWGNDNFRNLCDKLLAAGLIPVVVGDAKDYDDDGHHIMLPGMQTVCGRPLQQVVDEIAKCSLYVGNDTGLMHVAAALGKPCVASFQMGSMLKNHPWEVPWIGFQTKPNVDQMFKAVMQLRGEK